MTPASGALLDRASIYVLGAECENWSLHAFVHLCWCGCCRCRRTLLTGEKLYTVDIGKADVGVFLIASLVLIV